MCWMTGDAWIALAMGRGVQNAHLYTQCGSLARYHGWFRMCTLVMLFVCTCRFEQLALEYDSDELGDLDELEGGGASLEDFQDVLNEFLAEQQSSQYVSASGGHDNGGNAASKAALNSRLQDDAPDTAVAKVVPPALGP